MSSLDPKAKAWLDKFTEETYRAYFNADKPRHIHKKQARKAVYGANNARNRCIYSRAKGKKELDFGDDAAFEAIEGQNNLTNPEDAIIAYIDLKKKLTK